jgi:hypothetical protein
MEVVMRTLSNANPVIPHIAFRISSEDKLRTVHSKLIETVAQIVRWAVAGVLALIIVLPAIISINNSI